MSRTLVLGVGNTLLTDEGAGVHALRLLQDQGGFPDDVEFVDAGTLSFVLADAIAAATNLIVFDAAELDAPPGTVRVFEGAELDAFLLSGRRSVHEVGFADLMDIARLQHRLPPNRALVGIQPGDFGWGNEPGQAVLTALPEAAAAARSLYETWSDLPEAVNQ